MKTLSFHANGRLTAAVLLGAAALLVLPAAATAGTALHSFYGTSETFLQADINAMAATGAAFYRGGYSAVLNPALIVDADGNRLDLGLAMDQRHEDRFTPLYDTFSSYVTDTAIASNRHHYFNTGFAWAGRPFADRLPLAFAVALTERYSFTYDFSEEIRDPDSFSDPRDRILEERSLSVDGALRALSLATAWSVSQRFSLGATLNYAFGTRDQRILLRDFQDPDQSSDLQDEFDMDGINAVFGARLVVDPRLHLGVAYETAYEVSGDRTLRDGAAEVPLTETLEATVRYPARLSAGLTYLPRNEPRTVFNADLVYTYWSDLEDDRFEEDPLLEDTVDMRVGVQHTFYNGVPMRFGFRHVDSYADPEAGATWFSAGIGVPYGVGLASVSVELGKITYMQGHWFDYPAGFVSESQARVEDTNFRLGVGYAFNF